MKNAIQRSVDSIKNNPKKSLLILVLILGAVFLFRGNGKNKVETISVTRGDLVEEVSVTGTTKAVNSVDLAFELSGKVSRAPVTVGSKVSKGDLLASLNSSELEANLAKANADLEGALAKLNQISQDSGNTYDDARSNMVSRIRDSYAKSDDAIHNNIDRFFNNPRQSNPSVDFTFTDASNNYSYVFPLDVNLKLSINSSRANLETTLSKWQQSIVALDVNSDLTSYVAEAQANLEQTNSFLNLMSIGANSLVSYDYQYNATVVGFKTTIADARKSVSASLSEFMIAKEKLSSAPQINQSGQGSTFNNVLIQQAAVSQSRAAVASAQASLNKVSLRSPISGTVTKQDAKVGQIVTPGVPLISVISSEKLEIEANVSEVNIGKVNVGNSVTMTFDAFPNREFTGVVYYIDPAETLVDGVVNYKVKISFPPEESMKSGLTANLKIQTASKQNVLKLPLYSITKKDGKDYVYKTVDGKQVEQTVSLGFVGDDGSVEVLEGLSEGDVIQFGSK